LAILAKNTAVFGCLTNALAPPPICARELFSGSNGSASLVDCTLKKIFAWGCGFFVSDVISGGLFGPGRQPLGGSISLKFLLETRLQSESFDTLDGLLWFRVQKL